MRKISFLTLALALMTVGTLQAQNAQAWKDREMSAWKAFVSGDTATLRTMVVPTYHGLYGQGPVDLAGELAGAMQVHLQPVTIDSLSVSQLMPGRMLVTYQVTLKGTMGDTDISGTYWAASIWRNVNGTWKGVFHTNVPLQE